VQKELYQKKPFPPRCGIQNARGPLALSKSPLMVNAVLGGGQFVTTDQLVLDLAQGPDCVVARLLCDQGQKIFCDPTNKTADL